jgi:hypothetical protein
LNLRGIAFTLIIALTLIFVGCLSQYVHAAIAIASLEELQTIGKDPARSLHDAYILTGDIDASITSQWDDGKGFAPIGDFHAPFTGSFDGQGHVITGLTIQRPDQDDVGLFGCTDSAASLKNIGLNDGTIQGNWYVGGLVGVNRGCITDCRVSAAISGNYEAGGLAGRNQQGQISGCYTAGSVTGREQIGGLVGRNCGAVSDCHAASTLTTGSDSVAVGGLVGRNESGAISASTVSASVLGGGYTYYVGGLVGWHEGSITNCHVRGADDTQLSVTGRRYVGGLVGWLEAGVIEDCTAAAAVTATYHGAGLVALNKGTVTKVNAAGMVKGEKCVGGLIAENRGKVTHARSACTVTAEKILGGLIAENKGEVICCAAAGAVTGSVGVAGLVAANHGSLSQVYATGTICGESGVAGLIAANFGTLTNAYATGAVSGDGYVGGLIAVNGEQGTLSCCYGAGTVTGNEKVGGLIAINVDGTAPHCYWDTEGSHQATSAGGEGRSTAQMTAPYDPTTYVKWDFTEKWIRDTDGKENGGYPYLAQIQQLGK